MQHNRLHIARNLRDARENRGLTQQAVARHVGLSRSLVAQIELGNREASAEELSKLAALYERAVVDLVGASLVRGDDVLLSVLDRAPELLEPAARPQLEAALTLFRRAHAMHEALGRPDAAPPLYSLAAPRTVADAVTQGHGLATDERLRLGLGGAPVGELPWLAAATGTRTCVVDLGDDVLGLSLRSDETGVALLVNARQPVDEQRYAWAQQYALALATRGNAVAITRRGNETELVQIRSAAFAAGFVLPAPALLAWLEGINKAQPSRRQFTAYSLSGEKAVKAETRSPAGSQMLGVHDVAVMARAFGAPYKAVVYRLVSLGALSEAESTALLRPRALGVAQHHAELTTGPARVDQAGASPDVRVEVVEMAIEAYRRRLIDKAVLSTIAAELQMPSLAPERLVELADAAR